MVRCDPQPGESVLLIGAGPIGLAVLEFLRMRDITIIVMDLVESRLQFCRDKLGIKHTIVFNPDGSHLAALEKITGGELADIVVEDGYVSKIHAMLQVYSNAIVLADLNSTNGTTVNSRVVQKTVLRDNDIITLGRYTLKIENAPALSAELDEKVRASDTLTMQNLDDLRRVRARRTIAVLKHK